MRITRRFVGVLFLLIALSALIDFEKVGELFLFLSPDGQVVPLMMLSLQLLLLSVGVVGLVLLLPSPVIRFLTVTDRYIRQLGQGKFLTYALITGLVLRLAAVLLMPFNQWADFQSYDELGWEWATKGGYYHGDHLTAYWPPAYPFLLSRLYLLFGHVPQIGAYINVILSLSIVVLTYYIVRKVFDELIARWSTVIVLLFPSQILFTHLLASEMLFTSLLMLSVLLFLNYDRKLTARWYWILLGGVILGLSALTRSISKFILAVAIPVWFFESRDFRRTIKYSIIALTGFAIAVIPWMARNYSAVGVAKINTNTGINLFMGNQPGSGMGYNTDLANQYDVNDASREAWVDSSAWSRSWEYIFDQPGAFIKRGVVKVGFFYAIDTDALQYGMITAAGTHRTNHAVILAFFSESYYLVILLAALLGIVTYIRFPGEWKSRGGWLLLGIILYWTAVHFVFYGMGRYHFPIIPMISAFAALFVKSVIDKRIKIR